MWASIVQRHQVTCMVVCTIGRFAQTYIALRQAAVYFACFYAKFFRFELICTNWNAVVTMSTPTTDSCGTQNATGGPAARQRRPLNICGQVRKRTHKLTNGTSS